MKKRHYVFLAITVAALFLFGCQTAHVHDFSNDQESKQPTCTEPGERKSVCDCGEMLVEPIEATGHRFVDRICAICGTQEEGQGLVFHSNGDGTCSVAYDGFCSATRLEIPAVSPEGDQVTAVENYAFRGFYALKEIVIPEGVTTIGLGAFSDCTSLVTVRMSNSVTHIESSAFFGCSALHDIVLSEGLLHIGAAAFQNCTSLAVIYIPQNPISIGADAFYNTAYYNQADNWEEGVLLYLGAHLIKAISTDDACYTVRDGTMTVATSAFSRCGTIQSLTMPNSVVLFCDNAFGICTIQHLYLPDLARWFDVTFADADANPICRSSKVYFAKELLIDLVIPAEITEIADYAFAGYSKLRSITFHENITHVGRDAFRYCGSVEALYLSDIRQWLTMDVSHIPTEEFLFANYVNGARRDIKLYVDGKLITHLEVPDEIEVLWPQAFGICSTITALTLPEGIKLPGFRFEYTQSISSVYYKGQEPVEDVPGFEYPTHCFSQPTRVYFYTESDPSTGGNYWRYDENGAIQSWHICTPDGEVTCSIAQRCTDCKIVLTPPKEHVYENNVCTVCGSGTLVYVLNEDGSYTVRDIGTCADSDLHIPATYNGKPVTAIDERAFDNCQHLVSVYIPEGVTTIGTQAFFHCPNLVSVTFPASLLTIGEEAFLNCTQLTSVAFSEGLVAIGQRTFEYCINLQTLALPSSLTTIGEEAFSRCTRLTTVTLPEGLVTIEQGAFRYCTNLQTLTLPSSLTTIGKGAFRECTNLQAITLPSTLTSIANGLFYDCIALTSIAIPESVTTIGEQAFRNCQSLASIEIPCGVVTIEKNAFELCGTLQAVHVTDIAPWCSIAFANPRANPLSYAHNFYINGQLLTELTLPESVTEIGSYAFYGCTSLNSAVIGSQLTHIGEEVFCDSGLTSVTLADGVTQIYDGMFATVRTLNAIVIPHSVTSIGTRAFYGCRDLTSISIPGNVLSIGEFAFSSCSNLTTVTLEEGTTTIGKHAFRSCSALESITLPSTLTTIAECAFEGCAAISAVHLSDLVAWCRVEFGSPTSSPFSVDGTPHLYLNGTIVTELVIPEEITVVGSHSFHGCSITSLVIPSSVTSIADSAFENCLYLSTVTMADSVTSLGVGVFYGCHSLTSITLSKHLDSIPEQSFTYCTKLAQLTLHEGITSIDKSAFYGCASLASLVIPSTVTVIDKYAFQYCRVLTSITMSEGLVSIGDDAFRGCLSLAAITLPNSVTTLGTNAFRDCTGLTTAKLSTGLKYISDSAFYNCSGLIAIFIPDIITRIDEYAFYGCSSLVAVAIPDSVSYIGVHAFENCTGLAAITNELNARTISNHAFAGCTGLTSLTLGNKVTSIGNHAFFGCTGLTSVTIGNSIKSITIAAFGNCKALTTVIFRGSIDSFNDGAFSGCLSLTTIVLPVSINKAGCLQLFYWAYNISHIYYEGTVEQWESDVPVDDNNIPLASATVYYYSETQPTGAGSCWYWHWVDGVPTAW